MTMSARARSSTLAPLALLPMLAGAPPLHAAPPAERPRSVGQLDPVAPNGRVTGKLLRSKRDAHNDASVTVTVSNTRSVSTYDVPVDPSTRTFAYQLDTGLCRYRVCTITASAPGDDRTLDGSLELDNSPQVYLETPPVAPEPLLWGLDLTNRCVSSPDPEADNAYPTDEACAGHSTWTLGLQAERTLGVSCDGPPSQSIPINAPGSPIRFQWRPFREPKEQTPSTAYLRIDTIATPHPCGAGLFTWYAFMDHVVHGGGPFPPLTTLEHRVTLRYDGRAVEGSYRIFLSASAFWDGMHHMVELHVGGPGWWTLSALSNNVVHIIRTDQYNFVLLDETRSGMTLAPGETRTLTVNWAYIFYSLIQRGIFPQPLGGMDASAVGSVSAGIEVYNRAASNAVLAELWISDWRVTDTARLPGPSGW